LPNSPDQNRAAHEELPEGHTVTFTESLTTVLQCLLYILILPKWFLKMAPFSLLRRTYQCYSELGLYMKEIIVRKRSAMEEKGSDVQTKDLLTQLVLQQESAFAQESPWRTRLAESESWAISLS
jgi:hypothetical protein